MKVWFISLFLILFTMSSIVSFYAYIAYTLESPKVPPLLSNPKKAAGLDYKEVEFPSSNAMRMIDGWYIPGLSKNTVILSHGYGANREEPWVPMYELAKELHANRFNILMFDYAFARGAKVTGGILESKDLLGAIQYVKKRGDEQVYIWGFSMGAGTALQAALHSTDINGMILDSTFILDKDTMFFNMKQKLDILPRFPSVFLVNLMLPFISGFNLQQVPSHTVKTTEYSIPLFLIHGQKDDKAPYQGIVNFFQTQKANPASRLWLLPDGRHELIYNSSHKKEYIKRTMNFLFENVRKNQPKPKLIDA
ncbi:alpha/beta fold hydrolase [Paenibacillus aurantius]|uniref:Alpha/beta fold hydrolase n=1 Tax=Paenibacillus aurantius TaxID=2918900 RepID=A0AA96LGV9_9BACL|nr:alpha/beta fold hydrolase [Paenibacillus aurantius]WNQ11252.1 alpha/beta fold hydrolase [Paenibacillus aurantius]